MISSCYKPVLNPAHCSIILDNYKHLLTEKSLRGIELSVVNFLRLLLNIWAEMYALFMIALFIGIERYVFYL